MPGIFDSGIFDSGIFDTEAPADPSPEGFSVVPFQVYVNGVLQTDAWSVHHFGQLQLGMAAYDGEIGMGSVTVPGRLPYAIGDRLTIKDGTDLLFTGYLFEPVIERNPAQPLAYQTTYQVQDPNRQLIGRRTIDQAFPLDFSLNDLVGGFSTLIDSGAPTPTLDDTSYVDTSSTPLFPAKTYNSDGATDWIADIVRYTGKTVYLHVSQTENTFYLNVHALNDGPVSPLTIDDRPGNAGGDVFAPRQPKLVLQTADIKDGITARNGVDTVVVAVADTYTQGGISFEALLDYGGTDSNTLTLIANTVATTTATAQSAYTCTIGPMNGVQVRKLRVGSIVECTSGVWGLTETAQRVARITLTCTLDDEGNGVPGLWDAALQLGSPLRGVTATLGSGGQGTQLGALSTFTQWTSTTVQEDDPGIGVGEFETATCQLVDDRGDPVPVEGVTITWSVLQTDKTTTHPDYDTYLDDETTTATTSDTDISGQAHIKVKRTADTIGEDHVVKAVG